MIPIPLRSSAPSRHILLLTPVPLTHDLEGKQIETLLLVSQMLDEKEGMKVMQGDQTFNPAFNTPDPVSGCLGSIAGTDP